MVTPANPNVTIGGNTTVVCTVNSSIPIFQFVWTLNGRILPPNVVVRSSIIALNKSRGAWSLSRVVFDRSRGAKFLTSLDGLT